MSKTALSRSVPRRLLDLTAALLFVAVLAGMSWRVYQHRPLEGKASAERWALLSYRDAIYYPAQAVRDGVNPYDVVRNEDPQRYMQRYPVQDTLPLYSPLMLLVFAPFTVLPVGASMVAFAAMNAALFLALAWVTLRLVAGRPSVAGVFGLATLILASQAGRADYNAGQVALPLAMALIGALEWGDRRAWSTAWLVAFSTFKPTFGGPLGLLLAARRDWRSGLGGLVLGGAIGAVLLIVVFARSGDLSLERVADVLGANQSNFNQDPTVIPKTNKARLDTVAAIEYLLDGQLPAGVGPLAAAAILGLTGWVLWRTHRPSDVSAVSTASTAMMLALFICIYHNVYDVPVLVLPIAACAALAHPSWRSLSPAARWSVLLLLATPLVNGLWTDGFRAVLERAGLIAADVPGAPMSFLYRALCAINGLALTAAWAVLLAALLRRERAVSPASETVREDVASLAVSQA